METLQWHYVVDFATTKLLQLIITYVVESEHNNRKKFQEVRLMKHLF